MNSPSVISKSSNQDPQGFSMRLSWFSIVLSILVVVCGFLAILIPVEMSVGVLIAISWLLMIGGVLQFVHAFRCVGIGDTLWKIAVAVFYCLAGAYLRLNPGIGIAALTLALIGFFVCQGAVDIFAYIRGRKSGASGWVLLDGIITLILGVMIWRHWPASSLWVIGTLVGINMIMTGTTRLMLTLDLRRKMKDTGYSLAA